MEIEHIIILVVILVIVAVVYIVLSGGDIMGMAQSASKGDIGGVTTAMGNATKLKVPI